MKVLIGILLLISYACAEAPYPLRGFRQRTEFVIIPSVQTSQQLRGLNRHQNSRIIIPHTIYGPPPSNTLESLDYQKPPRANTRNLHSPVIRTQKQQIPATSYGAPIIPQQHTNAAALGNRDFANNPANIPPPRRQYLPVFEANNFNQDFTQNGLDEGVGTKTNQEVPGLNVNLGSANTPNDDVPVITGKPDVDTEDEGLRTTTGFDEEVGVTTANPNVYYYLPPKEVPSTVRPSTVRSVIRKRPSTTTTEAPIESDQDEDTSSSEDDEGLANRPNVAIANAFAGLYITPQPQQQQNQQSPTSTGSRILPAELPQDCNQDQPVQQPQQYATGYQFQNVITFQPVAYQQPLVYQNVEAYPQLQPYYTNAYGDYTSNTWRR